MATRVKTPLKSGIRLPSNPQRRETILEESRVVTSARQAAEWGMRSIQGSFGRLRLPLSVNQSSRFRLLSLCFRLHQVRVRRVGINQILSVYDPVWQDSMESIVEHVADRFAGTRYPDRVSRFHVTVDNRGITRRPDPILPTNMTIH